MDPRRLLAEQLDFIDRTCRSICRRNALLGDEADDFVSWVKERLVDRDYAIVRKFRRESRPTTYLTTVIGRLFLDYRNKLWGKWRPSARAKRLGPVGVLLDQLIHRDGLTRAEALAVMQARGAFRGPQAVLTQMCAEIEQRLPARPTAFESVDHIAGATGTDDALLRVETAARLEQVVAVLVTYLGRLPPEDRLIVRLHFFSSLTIAQIAKSLNLPQKPLYPRMKRILSTLAEYLSAEGLDGETVRELFDGP